MIRTGYYPGGKPGALTLSYDDGREYDRRLVEIMNRYGLKGTFHLNSANLGRPGYVTGGELPQLYAGHEISCHTCTHPFLPRMSREAILAEIWEDRRALEAYAGRPVVSMSYPFGDYDAQVQETLRACGLLYSRTVRSTYSYSLPEDFTAWHPTCHHREDVLARLDHFLSYIGRFRGGRVLYVWGHSYEFHDNDNWELIEEFCRKAAAAADRVWFATGLEIYDYARAVSMLRFDAGMTQATNLSGQTVWLEVDGQVVPVTPGETVRSLSGR